MPQVLPPGVRPPLALPLQRSSDSVYGAIAYGSGHPRRRRLRVTARETGTLQWRLPLDELAIWNDWFEDTLQAGSLEFATPVQERSQLPGVQTMLAIFAEPPRIVTDGPWTTITADVVMRRPNLLTTSRPYPAEVIDTLSVGMRATAVTEPGFIWPPEGVNAGMAPAAVVLEEVLRAINTWPPESLNAGMTPVSVVLAEPLRTIDTWPPESLNAGMAATSMTLQTILIPYTNWPAESLNTGMTATAVELLT